MAVFIDVAVSMSRITQEVDLKSLDMEYSARRFCPADEG